MKNMTSQELEKSYYLIVIPIGILFVLLIGSVGALEDDQTSIATALWHILTYSAILYPLAKLTWVMERLIEEKRAQEQQHVNSH